MVRLKRAPWPWAQSLRSGFSIAAPLAVGYATDALPTAMWFSMGAMQAGAADKPGSYYTRLQLIFTAGWMGAAGFAFGHIAVLPWPLVVLIMALTGVIAGIVSRWGAKYSIGTMQFLLYATIAIGLQGKLQIWDSALLFIAGVVFYALILLVEAFFAGSRAEHGLVADLATSLAELASRRAEDLGSEPAGTSKAKVEAARRKVTEATLALGKWVLETRSRSAGRSPEAEKIAAVLERGDNVFAEIMASTRPEELILAARNLEATAKTIGSGGTVTSASADDGEGLRQAVQTFAASTSGEATGVLVDSAADAVAAQNASAGGTTLELLLGWMIPGKDVLVSAIALGLCLGLSFCSRWFLHESHWYWVPLTVVIVMKPEFGSVFARAILRMGGTVGGAAIGAAALGFLPKGTPLVAMIALIAAANPWAARVSYAVQSVTITALILILLSFVVPGPVNVDFAAQRIFDTVVGSCIVLVFGYFMWPRHHRQHLAAHFQDAKKTLANYLIAVAERRDDLSRHRWSMYQSLSNLRNTLQGLMVEPPPVNEEAMAWYPLITAAERIGDRITALSASYTAPATGAEAQVLRDVAAYIVAMPSERGAMQPLTYSGADPRVSSFVEGIRGELRYVARLEEEDTSSHGADIHHRGRGSSHESG